MKLTPEQKSAVSTWITAGASISDVQKRLRDEFQVSLTFMDTRFLIDDLGLDLKAPPPKAKPAAPTPPPSTAAATSAAPDADAELIDDGDAYAAGVDEFADDIPAPAGGASTLTLDIDRLTRPGTVVSGTVKFSDGNTGKWALDQMGRLIFEPAVEGYRPSPADLQAFQRELSAQLQRKGY